MPSSATAAVRTAEPRPERRVVGPSVRTTRGMGLSGLRPDPCRRGDGAPTAGMLALFLLLCGVFAALATQGRPDVGRAVLAVGSVRAAFGGLAGWSAPPTEGAGGPEEAAGPLGHFAADGGEGPLRIRLDAGRVFDARDRVVRARLFLLARLAAASRAGYRVRVLAPAGTKARLAAVARLLDAYGADPTRLVFGVDPNADGKWRFEARPPEEAG